MDSSTAVDVEPMPTSAAGIFGSGLPRAQRYADLLVTAGVERGLIGPREPARIWSRHVLNSAVTAALYTDGERIVDVGSGAGLPGIPVALAVPALRVDLLEPLERRALFLAEVVAELELGERVRVIRGRAESREIRSAVGGADWVTSRAVAPLPRLVGWCVPLLRAGGSVAALKGASAADELAAGAVELRRAGIRDARVTSVGAEQLGTPVLVIVGRRDSGRSGPADASGLASARHTRGRRGRA